MTEERKEELKELLEEAMACLEIRLLSRNIAPLLPVDVYRNHLQQSWTSLVNYDPYIVNEHTKSRLFDFIRKEFAPFIQEDRIQSASSFIKGSLSTQGVLSEGFPLDRLLDQLLKITIVHGIEKTVSAFDRCTEKKQGSFQSLALLEGIRIKEKIQVFEGIQLIPLFNFTSELPQYFPDLSSFRDMPDNIFDSKTLLIIDFSISPIFHKPLFTSKMHENDKHENNPYQIKIKGNKFSDSYEASFSNQSFCRALSLACNSQVQIALKWNYLAEDELFNLSHQMDSFAWSRSPFGNTTEAGQTEIDRAKRYYKILDNPNSNIAEELQIPIDRWIKSKTSKTPVDKVIDLGIAFECLFVSNKHKISSQLRNNASRYLGKDKVDQEKLKKEFKAIYDCRCDAVHEGKLEENVTIGGRTISISKFITNAQNLCRDSILKILEDGEFPDWNDLILG